MDSCIVTTDYYLAWCVQIIALVPSFIFTIAVYIFVKHITKK
jgi:hypothetical protein